MKLRIRTKIVFTSAVLYSIFFFLVSLLLIYDAFLTINQTYVDRLEKYTEIVAGDLKNSFLENGSIDYSKFKPREFYEPDELIFEIFDENLNPLSTNEPFLLKEDLEEYLGYHDFIFGKRNSKKHYYISVYEEIINDQKIYVAGVIDIKNFEYYIFKLHLLAIMLLAIVVIAFISLYLSKVAFKPVDKMVKDVKKIRGTNLHERITVPEPQDEIRELAETMNGMLKSIEDSFKSQKRFIADASHEIKTPLAIIQAKLELMQEKVNKKDFDKEFESLFQELERLTNLSKSLLTLAKIDSESLKLDKSLFRLDELLVELVQFFNSAAEIKRIKIIPTINDAIEIFADKSKIKSVLDNILDNAIKYSPEDSLVKIELSQREKMAEISIVDNGPGISEKDLSNVLNRFYRSNEIRALVSGSGLGLSIAEEIIKQHNGSIHIKSKLGEGTTVIVLLPLK